LACQPNLKDKKKPLQVVTDSRSSFLLKILIPNGYEPLDRPLFN